LLRYIVSTNIKILNINY